MPVAQIREPVLEPCDASQKLNVRCILCIPVGLEGSKRFLSRLNFALGGLDCGLFLVEAALELVEFFLGAAMFLLGICELFRQSREFALSGFAGLFEVVSLASGKLDAAFQVLDLAAQAVELFGPLCHSLLCHCLSDTMLFCREFALCQVGFKRDHLIFERAQGTRLVLDFVQQTRSFVRGEGQLKHSLGLLESLVARGLLRLSLERRNLALDLAEHVVHARQVLLRRAHLALGFFSARLVLADSRGLFN